MMSDMATPYKGYSIVPEGHGFYNVLSPDNESIGSCEGSYTAREIVDDHIRKVYGWWKRTSNLSPLQTRAARFLTSAQAEKIIELRGYLTIEGFGRNASDFEPDESDIAAMNDRDFHPISRLDTDTERYDYEDMIAGGLDPIEYDRRWGNSRGA